ncbi:MAG: hypothetical protein IBX61_09310 [Thermoleophilia bacterium]|nr:hypothetical protein [Thermoleophilia bacterium]
MTPTAGTLALEEVGTPTRVVKSGPAKTATVSFIGRTRKTQPVEDFEVACACAVVERKKTNPFSRFLKRVDLPDNFCSQEVREQAQKYYLEDAREAAAAMPDEGDLVTGEFSE